MESASPRYGGRFEIRETSEGVVIQAPPTSHESLVADCACTISADPSGVGSQLLIMRPRLPRQSRRVVAALGLGFVAIASLVVGLVVVRSGSVSAGLLALAAVIPLPIALALHVSNVIASAGDEIVALVRRVSHVAGVAERE